jgi:hypothetical protein
MRRFVFKLELEPLPPAKAEHAFKVFFGETPPSHLLAMEGLTPGDFAVVARQIRFEPQYVSVDEIIRRLASELSAKPHRGSPIGFRPFQSQQKMQNNETSSNEKLQ